MDSNSMSGTKRNMVEEEENTSTHKRLRVCRTNSLLCPISLELPWEPVTAEDGIVYDRESIEEHFRTHAGDLRSPINNEEMGKKLLPAPGRRNIIEDMIEAGVVEGDVVDKWNEKVKQKKEMEELMKKAEGGNEEVMYRVAVNFVSGHKLFKKDRKLAFQWYEKSHKKGYVPGTAALGQCYLEGIGTDKCLVRGVMLVMSAAKDGSNLAAYILGTSLARGKYGMPVDKEEAIHWLEKAADEHAGYDHLAPRAKEEAKKKLTGLKAEKAGVLDA